MMVILALLSCAPDYLDVDAKTVGVGYDPEAIGPAPTPYGGVVEYSWVNFAGGGLSLALMQLGSFDEVGPDMVGFAPPYSAVYGFSYLFTEKLAAADSLGGVTSVPPEAEETCYTTYEASGPIGSFKTVDVGDYMALLTEDGTGGVYLERQPGQYLSNAEDAFAYYSGIHLYREEPQYSLIPGSGSSVSGMEKVIVETATFPSGKTVYFRFPGGKVPENAPLGSIPVGSASVPATPLVVPQRPGGVQLEWKGRAYDSNGGVVAEEGEQSTCLSFTAIPGAQGPADCAAAAGAVPDGGGQIFTGPWDTEDGQVLLRWEPGENPDEYVSIAVRFLGAVDRTDPNFLTEVVEEDASKTITRAWAEEKGKSVPDIDVPAGTRSPTACEDEGSYVFNPVYLDAQDELIPSMRGDPFHNMSEVTCRLKDDGEFALTEAIVADALAYARAKGSEGVVFYFGRSTEAEVEVPDAMDTYGNRKVITPIKVSSRAIHIGRFWLE